MTNEEMEMIIQSIRLRVKYAHKLDQRELLNVYTSRGFTETNVRYCYVLATGKNMTI